MRKKITKLLALTLAFTSLGFVSSCKDTEEDDIAQLRNDFAQQLAGLQKDCDCAKKSFAEQFQEAWANDDLKTLILNAMANDPRFAAPVVTIGENGNWFVNGEDTGKPSLMDAPVVTIGENGNWVINGEDTGKPSKGADGTTPTVTIGENGNWVINGEDTGKPSKGADGTTPTVAIGTNGNWVINGTDTGIPAKGQDGNTPTIEIGANGNWFINGVDTGKPSKGADGTSTKGDDGITPHIGENGNWWIGETDTKVPATAKGEDGKTPVVTIGDNGNWYINGEDTGKPSRGADGTGTPGTPGTTPTIEIGDNGNWFINGEDTGKPSRGENGTNGTNTDIDLDSLLNTPEFQNYINQYITLTDWNEKLDSLKDVYATKGQVDSLETRVQELEAYKKKFDKLQEEIKQLKESLAKLITGIIVQGTYNPLYGTFALPVGVNSNVLVAYHGMYNGSAPLGFPTDDPTNYIFKDQVLTEDDWEMIDASKKGMFEAYKVNGGTALLSDAADNAGKLYLTINPNTVDFKDVPVSLVNSQDEESGIKLQNLRRSDKVLTFGYTRAADNGFYEVDAHLDAADIAKVTMKVEPGLATAFKEAFGAVKKDVGTALNKGTITVATSAPKLATLAGKLYNQFNGILPAEAVKASYTDVNGTHNVYSNYGVAATAIKPLSFAFGKDFDYKYLPGYKQINNFIDGMNARIKKEIKVRLKNNNIVDKIMLAKIEYLRLDSLKIDKADFTVYINDSIYVGDQWVKMNFNDTIPYTLEIPFTYEAGVAVPSQQITIAPQTVIADGSAYNSKETEEGDTVTALVIPLVGPSGETDYGNVTVPLADIGFSVVGTTDEINVYTKDTVITVKIDTLIKNEVQIPIKLTDVLTRVELGKIPVHLEVNLTEQFSGETGLVTNLLNQIKQQFKNVNDMLVPMNNLLTAVQDQLVQLQTTDSPIDKALDKVVNGVKNFLDKINNLGVKGINSINRFIQPVMIVNAGRARIASGAYSQATEVGSSVTLHPTTFTGEIVTPCFKKHVAVTNVFKTGAKTTDNAFTNGSYKDELMRVNGQPNMNAVLEGGLSTAITLTGLKDDLTYEIAYSALDYSGNIVTRKYYIRH